MVQGLFVSLTTGIPFAVSTGARLIAAIFVWIRINFEYFKANIPAREMEGGELRQRMTLKEKLKNHYHSHPPSFAPDPKEASKIGVTFFGSMLASLMIEGMFFLIPANFSGDFYSIVFFEVLAIFCFVETCMNFYRTWYDVANYVRKSTKEKYFQEDETPQGWTHCFTCQIDTPPRSYHCKICNKCMLKRDHHCYFTSSCIGFQNQKYFIMTCFYTVTGCLVAIYLQLIYLNKIFPLYSTEVFHLFPLLSLWDWLTGIISFWTLFLILHTCLTVLCAGMCTMFMSWQMLLIVSGKTGFEAKRNIHRYDMGILDNVRTVFGPLKFCAVLFLAPMSLPQLGDGIHWPNRKTQKKY